MNATDDVNASSFTNVTDTTALLNSTEIPEALTVGMKHPIIGVCMSLISVVTVLGNMLVILAVARNENLRTATHFLIASLAVADILIGGIVVPFAVSYEMQFFWYYGALWCDMWHAFDVLGSTASIMNLCIIALDRYWAVTDPLVYPIRMSNCRVAALIAVVWVCSALISFPAIAWWQHTMPPGLPSTDCLFTDNRAYLIGSSLM